MAAKFRVCFVSEKSEKPKFRFSPDATPFVPKNFRGAKVTASDTKASALSVEAREFYPRNYVCRPEVRVVHWSFYVLKCFYVFVCCLIF